MSQKKNTKRYTYTNQDIPVKKTCGLFNKQQLKLNRSHDDEIIITND